MTQRSKMLLSWFFVLLGLTALHFTWRIVKHTQQQEEADADHTNFEKMLRQHPETFLQGQLQNDPTPR